VLMRKLRTMSVQPLHPCKLFMAPVAKKWPKLAMQPFMALAVVPASKVRPAAKPLAQEWLFIVVRPNMTLQVKTCCCSPGQDR
jgi:hypothetical protein